MNKPIWHKGPPPSIGWWPASNARIRGVYRWWDGEKWSGGIESTTSANDAVELASFCDPNQHLIEWTDRPKSWPKRSRT